MSPRLKAVVRNIAVALHIPAAMALLSLPVAMLAEEWPVVAAFATTAVLGGVVAHGAYRLCNVDHVLGTKFAMITVVLAWGLVPVVGALPYLIVGLDAEIARSHPVAAVFGDPWAALFEAFSGFTSTGLTMVEKESGLPLAILWWRSFTQWVGGVGVIVLMLTVFHPSFDARRLYVSEAREQGIAADLVAGVRTIWWIYLVYTAFAIGLLRLSGMDWWQALNYGMAGIATGGFAVTDGSLGDFGTAPKLAMMLVIALGAISFAVHARILTRGQVGRLWTDTETRCLLVLFTAGSGVLTLENLWYGGDPLFVDSAFQWVSALGTAGFNTVDVGAWSPTAHLLMALGMAVGGAAGSTVGGLKMHRVMRVAEAAYFRIKMVAAHPWKLTEHKQISDEEERRRMVRALEATMTMLAIWAATLFVGTLLILHAAGPDAGLNHVLFDVASALGNVGLTTGITGPELPWYGKAGLMLIMWMGRLEAVPVIVLLGVLFQPFIKGVEAVEHGTTAQKEGQKTGQKTGTKKTAAKKTGAKKASGSNKSASAKKSASGGGNRKSGSRSKSSSGSSGGRKNRGTNKSSGRKTSGGGGRGGSDG